MKIWQKNILHIVAFCLVLLCAMALVGHYLMPTSNRYLTGYSAGGILGEEYDSIDVLVMGDSNVAQAISPMEWYRDAGVTGYNYSVGWFTVFKAYYRLQTVFSEQSPKVLVLGTAMAYSKQPDESYLGNAVWDVVGELFPLFRFHENWKEITPANLLAGKDYSWRDFKKGYGYLDTVAAYNGDEYMYDRGTTELPIGVALYYDRILSLCAEHGTEVLLVTVPTTSWSRVRHNGIAAYAAERGVEYIDLNPEISPITTGLDWQTDTGDAGTHLNYSGARKVTAALGDYLMENYDLPDRRGEAGYESWDKDLAAYRALTEPQPATPENAAPQPPAA